MPLTLYLQALLDTELTAVRGELAGTRQEHNNHSDRMQSELEFVERAIATARKNVEQVYADVM